jgi:hypothetical protein
MTHARLRQHYLTLHQRSVVVVALSSWLCEKYQSELLDALYSAQAAPLLFFLNKIDHLLPSEPPHLRRISRGCCLPHGSQKKHIHFLSLSFALALRPLALFAVFLLERGARRLPAAMLLVI